MRPAVPASSIASHAMSIAVSHGSGASLSALVSVSAQVLVAAATASSAERLLASAEEAARSAALVDGTLLVLEGGGELSTPFLPALLPAAAPRP